MGSCHGTTLAGLLSALALGLAPHAAVPLARWTGPGFPNGLDTGYTMGVSFGDYDADGYIDLFACFSGSLWHNQAGQTWEFAANLADTLLPPAERRYGAHFGDYDRNGFPDIATSPRTPAWGDDRLHLLRNLGVGPYFADVAGDPSIVDVQPYGNGETLCWADVDGDRLLDLFAPVYPGALGPGNFFLKNIGPSQPGVSHGFVESSEVAGLDNPPGMARPEGAQIADVDFDGDPDVYSNGTLYQNVSSRGVPRFDALQGVASGILHGDWLDEGAILFDYDLDGDQDLIIGYREQGVYVLENRGDGTFFETAAIVDSPLTGLGLGVSAEDWDGDGDVDLTTREVFRQNMFVEEGARHFTVATHSIPADHLTSAIPAWGDWDKDGDLDALIGNWGDVGRLYDNTLYTPATPDDQKRHVRIRVVGDEPGVPRGVETEYGATAEIRILNVTQGSNVRKKFVASSHGYLNQNEYALTFFLPPDPRPGDPAEDVRFDVSVDFPGISLAGLWRIDQHVNPALGGIDLGTLIDREITVYRCGAVRLDGMTYDPTPLATKTLSTTTAGLVLPRVTQPPPDPVPAPGPSWYTGLAFETSPAYGPVRIEEVLLDGQLDAATSCGGPGWNVAIWDATNAAEPVLVSTILGATSPRNRRTYIRGDVVLAPGRSYRIVARVTEYRATSLTAPPGQGPATVHGGLFFGDPDPCSGQQPAQAAVEPTEVAMAVRLRPVGAISDPVGPTLRLTRGFRGTPLLSWGGIPAPLYQVLRCDAATQPCAPAPIAQGTETSYVDRTVTTSREMFWYLIRAIDECTGGP